MASNAQRSHYALEQNRFAEQKARKAIDTIGQALPCRVVAVSGSIVTVSFEVNSTPYTLPEVTIPVATTHYFFQPIQLGDFGVTIPADVYLGGVSGLGGGTPDLTLPATLAALLFLPVASKSWTPTDANKAEIFGPSGTIIRNGAGNSIVTVDNSSITLSVAGHSIVINSTGVIIDGRVFLTHEHSGVQSGANNTGGVV